MKNAKSHGTELTISRGRGAAYSKEVLAIWTRANGIGSIGSNLNSCSVASMGRVGAGEGSTPTAIRQVFGEAGHTTKTT